MKFIFSAILILSLNAFAAEKAEPKKDAARTPASIEPQIVDARVKLTELLSQSRAEGNNCSDSAYMSEILHEVRALNSSASFKPHMFGNVTRQVLAKNLEFKVIAASKWTLPETSKELEQFVTGTEFYAPASGAYGSPQTLAFLPNGQVRVTTKILLEQAPWWKFVEANGTWGIQVKDEKHNTIKRVWYKVNGKTLTYRFHYSYLHEGWILVPKSFKEHAEDSYIKVRFFNTPQGECEA